MILSSPARVPAAYGARPVYEADMIAVVGDAAKLMAARTPLEALQALKEIRSFIELSDLTYDPQVQLDGPNLLAANVVARLGVLGGGKGADILDNPLNAVLWIAESVRAGGKTLKEGDLLSLGSFSALLPPKAGSTVTVRYIGLTPAPAQVTVTFE